MKVLATLVVMDGEPLAEVEPDPSNPDPPPTPNTVNAVSADAFAQVAVIVPEKFEEYGAHQDSVLLPVPSVTPVRRVKVSPVAATLVIAPLPLPPYVSAQMIPAPVVVVSDAASVPAVATAELWPSNDSEAPPLQLPP